MKYNDKLFPEADDDADLFSIFHLHHYHNKKDRNLYAIKNGLVQTIDDSPNKSFGILLLDEGIGYLGYITP